MLLRITVGWHILYEGIWKYQQQEFSADGYLSQASGPFAHYFHYKVMKDFEGRDRLSEKWNLDELNDYHKKFVDTMKLDEAGKARADRALVVRTEAIQKFFKEPTNKGLFEDHFKQWDDLNARRDAIEAKGGGVVYERQRIWEGEKKLRDEARPWLAWVDDQQTGLREDLQSALPIARQDERLKPSISEIFKDKDQFVVYANIAIGACMILGLFSRAASLGGGVFLMMIVAAKWQWPGYYAPEPHPAQGHSLFVTKEFVEMMVCFTLAMLPTGRWGGLDYFLHGLFVRPFTRNKD